MLSTNPENNNKQEMAVPVRPLPALQCITTTFSLSSIDSLLAV